MTDLNNLPTIITAPGDYLMRNGLICRIHEVKPGLDNTTTSFDAKGCSQRLTKSNKICWDYNIWHVSGRKFFHKECGTDIVAKVFD